MVETTVSESPASSRALLAGIAATSAALLMTELALTRIFSVTMLYHFAFLAISIALFGLSASGVYAFVRRRHFAREETGPLLGTRSLVYAACTVVSLSEHGIPGAFSGSMQKRSE